MKKTLFKNYKFLLLSLAIAFVGIFMLTTMVAPVSSIASAGTIYENTANYVDVDVTAYGLNGQTVQLYNSGTVTIKKGSDSSIKTYESYRWKDVKYLKVSIDSLSNIPDVAPGENYVYSYSMDYYPLEISATNEINIATYAAKTINPIHNKTAATKTDITKDFYFFLDDNANTTIKQDTMTPFANGVDALEDETLGYSYKTQGGWGIYIFYFECQGLTYSKVYEIVPTKLSELTAASFSVSAQEYKEGTQSISGKYVFSVNDDFLYVKRNQIKWYLNGTGTDGVKYVLTKGESDLTAENDGYLFETDAIARTGATFTLDTKIQGKWKATAVISEVGSDDRVATSEEVSTIKPFSTTAIIWIVTGVTVVAVVVVAVIIAVTIKKEKTW